MFAVSSVLIFRQGEGMSRIRLSIASVATLAACVFSGAVHAQGEPLRLGFLTIRSGPLAAGGKQMEDGLKLFLKERSNTLAGRKVELFTADTGGQPAITKTKAQELVERDKVNVIIGPLAAFEALAVDDYVRRMQVPVISPSAAAEDLTQRKPNPWFVRAVGTSAQSNHPLGEYAARDLKYKRIAIVADDFAFGHESAAGFQRTFEENGGRIVQKLWSPLNVADYGSYISQINPKVDAIFASFAGGNGVKFLRQYSEYGLKAKIPVLAGMTTVDEGVLKTMGDEALGVVSAGWYSAGLQSASNKRFVAAMQREYKEDPGYYSMGAYGAALMLEQALKTVGGKFEDRDALMAALRKVEVPGDPRGTIRLDALGNPLMDVYIRKVERRDGKLVNTVVKTYPAVSQFWNYDAKDFLANPVYSRDWPPAKNIEK
jgi:branched-chain amino acid transport system substrate-binding protein